MIVWITDPSSIFRRRVRNALNGDSSYDYREVDCGQDLLGLLVQDDAPGIIILRDQLDDMRGLEAARAIRDIGDHAHTPIFLLASSATHEDVLEAVECGVDRYIILPFDEKALAHKVGQAAERMRRSARLRCGNGYTRQEIV